MSIVSKWLKLQTSNLTHNFSGTIEHDTQNFFQKVLGQGHMTPKFWGVKCQQLQNGQELQTSNFVCKFLPARRYASAGYSDRNVSVRPSVRHAPVLCQNEEIQRHDFFTICQPQDSSFRTPNFITKFQGVPPERRPQTRVGRKNSAIFQL